MITTPSFLRALVAAALVLACGLLLVSHAPAHAGGQSIGCVDMTFGGSGTSTNNGCSNTGSTTPLSLTTGMATTTMTIPTGNATSASLNLDVVPASASTVYTFTVSYSNNGVDWFQEDANSVTTNVTTHTAGAMIHTWTPGVTATTTRAINLTTHAAKFMQVGFKVTGANGKLYPQAILQNAVVN